MVKIEETEVLGISHAIRGMRNPMNSWGKSDTTECFEFADVDAGFCRRVDIGDNDHTLMMQLVDAGSVHAKYRRMIVVYADITAPLYWWKEFDTYKVGTVANSCSTMHKIHAKEFALDDFSHEQLVSSVRGTLMTTIDILNTCRDSYLESNDKKWWWQLIQLLPASYNQKRTVMMNYEVLANIYEHRLNHKLDEWRAFCRWICLLPNSDIITGQEPYINHRATIQNPESSKEDKI